MTIVQDRQRAADIEDRAPAPERRAVARMNRLADLMVRRPDLHGVSTFADLTAESVSWSV